MMRTCGRFVVAGLGVLALGIVGCGPAQEPTESQPAQGQQAPAPTPTQAAQARPPIPPHPSTQSPEHLVTGEQMLKWEKELSNWGRWGPKDQRGTLNLITPEKSQAAARLVKEGITASLHHFPSLTKSAETRTGDETKHWMTSVDPKTGQVRGALDGISFSIHDTQDSHMDAFCHYQVESSKGQSKTPLVYNGYPQELSLEGCGVNSIDNMGKSYITRGILIDMPLMRGVESLEPHTPIYPEDLEAWEKFANVKIGSGDAIFLRVGRWVMSAKGPWNVAGEIPGLHASALPWLKKRDVALLAGEGVIDVQPSGVEGWRRPFHMIGIPILGTPLVDNGYFEDVAAIAARLKRWEFMVSWAVMQIPHGTATPFTALAAF